MNARVNLLPLPNTLDGIGSDITRSFVIDSQKNVSLGDDSLVPLMLAVPIQFQLSRKLENLSCLTVPENTFSLPRLSKSFYLPDNSRNTLLVLIFAVIEMTVFLGYIFSRICHRMLRKPPKLSKNDIICKITFFTSTYFRELCENRQFRENYYQ